MPSRSSEARKAGQRFDFAGWGKAQKIVDLGVSRRSTSATELPRLGVWRSTAICGNDISSSVLYVSALSIMAAGAWAPVALLMVAGVLYWFRRIYGEVGSALPLNGGTYTLLLNTTNKRMAAMAACLTLISYVATAVISGGEAMHYLAHLVPSLNVFNATVALLALFAFLNWLGIGESAGVALGIFIFHLFSLTLLAVLGTRAVLLDPSIFFDAFANPLPEGRGLGAALFLGFCAAMLGVSGFESSANFIEEQKEGVFPKTLRNMWLVVTIFNPLICLLALGLVRRTEVAGNAESLLALMGDRSGGAWLAGLISIDAVLVLSGAVLTSYVGVIGLVRRMALDRCLPAALLRHNELRGTNHWIILAFFLLCTGVLVATKGQVSILAGVYTLSFLGVMAAFAVGNMLLKRVRANLARSEQAGWPTVILGLIAVVLGLLGNMDPRHGMLFFELFVVVAGLVLLMLARVPLMKAALFVVRGFIARVEAMGQDVHASVQEKIDEINSRTVVYFTKADSLASLNEAALYVLRNEQTDNMLVVHAYEKPAEISKHLAANLKVIDREYPQLRIDFLAVKGSFGPDMIDRLSKRLKVPKNYMFIGTPGSGFGHKLPELGGVRVITG